MNCELKRATLVNVSPDKDIEKTFEELTRLAKTADYEVVAHVTQRRERPDKATYVGKGKLEELKNVAIATNSDIIIFDNDVSGSQFYNLEKYLEIDVIDRKTLILEIFSKHAISNEGKLQVELAQKKNFLPRVIGKGVMLSRQGGGGGGGGGARRGGGEQQLELDRRTIRQEIAALQDKIDKLAKERALRRQRREKSSIKTVSIAGYTNAGKSTLMNTLTKANVLEEDKLFATLDPVSRKLFLEQGKEFLLIDTVGFISRLPHELISAFKSTLEEITHSDLILHIVDGSSENALAEFDVASEVLSSLGAKDIPTIVVMNKCDKGLIEKIPAAKNVILLSAKTGEGVEKLKEAISETLFS
jgi:GTP-binding protein HflX